MAEAALLTSNANYAPTDIDGFRAMGAGAYRMELEELKEIAYVIGSDGAELMPVNSPLYSELQGITPERAKQLGDVVVTFHMGFLGQATEQPSRALEIPSERIKKSQRDGFIKEKLGSIVVPDGEQSLYQLAAIAKNLGRTSTIPCVVFPDRRGHYRYETDKTRSALFPAGAFVQLTPDVLAAWNIHPAKAANSAALISQLHLRGYKAVLPTFHFGRKGKVVDYRIGENLDWPQKPEDAVTEYTDNLLDVGMFGEVHIELNRNDFGKIDPDWVKVSLQEAIAMMRGDTKKLRKLPLGRRLEQLRSHGWVGPVVVEVSLSGMIEALQAQGLAPTKRNILKGHFDINGHAREELPFLKKT